MPRVTIATVVEGQGEVLALPVLLRRMAGEFAPETWLDLPRPHRVDRGVLLGDGGIEKATAQAGPAAGVLVLADADDDCPARCGPHLRERAQKARPDRRIRVVLANREFEAWFLAAASSLGGVRGLRPDLEVPQNPERPRDCKGWLTAHRTDGQSYKPAADQAALTAVFDLDLARCNSPSFAKFCRDVRYLVTGDAADTD